MCNIMPPQTLWIQNAHLRKGALTRTAHQHGYAKALPFARAVRSHPREYAPVTRRRANVALTLNRLRPRASGRRLVLRPLRAPRPVRRVTRRQGGNLRDVFGKIGHFFNREFHPNPHPTLGHGVQRRRITRRRGGNIKDFFGKIGNFFKHTIPNAFTQPAGHVGQAIGNFFLHTVTPALEGALSQVAKIPILGIAAKAASVPLQIEHAILGQGRRRVRRRY